MAAKKSVKPAEFDFEAWLSGASRPTRSVDVYQRGDLLAEADKLARRIEEAEALEASGEESLTSGGSDVDALRESYAEIADAYYKSALTLKFRALDEDEWAELIRGAVEDDGVDRKDAKELTVRTIAAALVSPALSHEQLRKLRDAVGDAQFHRVVARYNELKAGAVEPSADFLPKRSTSQEPDES